MTMLPSSRVTIEFTREFDSLLVDCADYLIEGHTLPSTVNDQILSPLRFGGLGLTSCEYSSIPAFYEATVQLVLTRCLLFPT